MMLAKIRDSLAYQFVSQLALRYRHAEMASMSAEIAYYLILAFFPFLFFLMNLLSYTPLSNRLLLANFSVFLPHDTAALVKDILVHTLQAKSGALLFLGMVGSLWAASQGMAAIMRGLNRSYRVKETRKYFQLHLLALIATLGVSAIIIFSFFMIVFGRILGSRIFGLIGEKSLFYSLWPLFRYGITFTFLLATFILIYRYLPNRRLPFKNLMPGAIFAALGWVGVSWLFAYYVNNFATYEKVYGSLGSIFALIVWLDLSALVILFGGEIIAICSCGNEQAGKNE